MLDVLIISSSRDEIDDYYKSVARNISHYLATNGDNLIFGAASTSMMGICYDEFKKNNCNIYAFTTRPYIEDLKNLNQAKHYICNTTFEMKQRMFENADLIVCLPGGPGTISELTSYIEEKRSNDKDVPIIIYDDNNFFEYFYKMYDFFIENNFVGESIKEMYDIANNKEEFIELYEKIKFNERRR